MFGHGVKWIEGFPEMEFDMAGTTGNVYKVIIGKVPFCSCPDSLKGNQCKHICYGTYNTPLILSLLYLAIVMSIITDSTSYQVLVNALKAPAHLQYQLAFLSTVPTFASSTLPLVSHTR